MYLLVADRFGQNLGLQGDDIRDVDDVCEHLLEALRIFVSAADQQSCQFIKSAQMIRIGCGSCNLIQFRVKIAFDL